MGSNKTGTTGYQDSFHEISDNSNYMIYRVFETESINASEMITPFKYKTFQEEFSRFRDFVNRIYSR
jgi:hypothetical protein